MSTALDTAAARYASAPDRDDTHPSPLAAPARRRPWENALAACVIVLHAAITWIGRAPAMLTRQDDARYLALARAIRAGTYRDLMWPDAPLHHMYPPGYPALLALWTTIGGERFDWLVALQIVLSAATLAVTFVAVRRVAPAFVALGALAMLAGSPSSIEWSGQIASEGALALCFALALWAATLPRGQRRTVVLVVAAVLAPLMRTAGVVLPIAVALDLLLERRLRAGAAMGALAIVVVGAVLAWTLNDPNPIPGSSYAGDLATTAHAHGSRVQGLVWRAWTNAVYYPSRGIPWMLAVPSIAGTVLDNLIATAVVTIGLAAGVVWTAIHWRLAALVLAGSVAILLAWPYQVDRYLLPVLPVLVPTLLLGLWAVAQRVLGARNARVGALGARIAVGAIVLVCVASSAGQVGRRLSATRACPRGAALPADACLTPDQASFFHAVPFVRDSLPTGARVLSAKSETLYLYTGRVTVPLTRLVGLDSAAFWNTLGRADAQYVLLGQLQTLERRRLAPRLRDRCTDLRLVASFAPHTYLFAVAPNGAATRQTSPACAALDRYLRETFDLVELGAPALARHASRHRV